MLDTYMYVKKNPVPNGPLVYCDIPAWEPVFVATKVVTVESTPFKPYRKPYKPKSLAGDGKVYTSRAKDGGISVRPHDEGARQTNVLALSSSGDQNRPKALGVSFPLELPERFILQHTQPGDSGVGPGSPEWARPAKLPPSTGRLWLEHQRSNLTKQVSRPAGGWPKRGRRHPNQKNNRLSHRHKSLCPWGRNDR